MKVNYLTLGGQQHPVCFSLGAGEELVEKFGVDLHELPDKLFGGTTAEQLRAMDVMLTVLLKYGRQYAQYAGESVPEPLPCRPIDLIGIDEIGGMKSTIFGLIGKDAETSVELEDNGKNAEPTQGE